MFNQLSKKGEKMVTKIKEVREKRGMTQEELSEKSGISRTTISDLENGKIKNTSASTMVSISKALKCKVKDIFFI